VKPAILLWALGVPIPIVILILLFSRGCYPERQECGSFGESGYERTLWLWHGILALLAACSHEGKSAVQP
jgi:hypothetical protein